VAKARKVTASTGVEIRTVPRVGYSLVAESGGPARDARRSNWLTAAIAAAVLLIGALSAVWWERSRTPSRPEYPPVTVGQFTTRAQQPELRARTAEISSQVVDALLKSGVSTVRGSTPQAGTAYFIRGEISAKPAGIHALIQVDDTAAKRTVVSREFDLDPDETPLLADKVAASVADAVTETGAYYALTATGTARDEVAAFMGIAMQVAAGDYLEAQARARQFLESRPQSRLAPFALAFTTIYALPELPPGEKPGAVVSARKAAHLAQQRLPDFGDVYIAECKLYPVAYAACEKLARETLRKDPSAPTMRSQLALLLMDAGRLEEAHSLMSKSLAESPYNPSKVIQSLYLAQLTGARSEESYLWAYAQRYWPKLRFANQRFASLMANGRWQEAEQILPLVVRVAPGSESTLTAIFAALHRRTEANKRNVERACLSQPVPPVPCFTALSMLGRPSAALQVARRFYPKLQADRPSEQEALFIENGSDPGPLFFIWGDGAKAMREDPRFAELAKQVGLIPYWQSSGPPDICNRRPVPVCKLADSR